MVSAGNAGVLVRLAPPLRARLDRAAAAHGVSGPELIRGILDDTLPRGRAAKSYNVPLPGFPEVVE